MQRNNKGSGSLYRVLPLLAALVALAVAACAPNRLPPGPGPTEARLEPPDLPPTRLIAGDGAVLPMRHWLPEPTASDLETPKAAIVALHGINDYSNAFEGAGAWLATRGFAVYAYDQRGFGETEHVGLWAGTDTLVDDLHTAVRLVRARHPEAPLFVLGESMGGAIAIVGLSRPDAPAVEGAILSAPAVWARGTMPVYQRVALWLAERLMPGARFSGSGLGVQASDNIEMLRGLGRDPLVIKRTRVDAMSGLTNLMTAALEAGPRLPTPALVLYGAKDQIVPRGPTMTFWRSLPGLADGRHRPVLYADGWHMLLRDLQAETVLADLAHWMDNRASALPSGADLAARSALGEEGADETAALTVMSKRTVFAAPPQ